MEILAYITFGFLLLQLLVAFINTITNINLPIAWNDEKEMVSILIPARNESSTVCNLLADIKAQDFGNYEVLILDDSSTDNTAEVVMNFIDGEAAFKLIKGSVLPQGWLGKNWACHQLAQLAGGDYFLFLDADVRIRSSLIGSSLHLVKEKKLALLSLFPGQEMKSAGEWLVVPLMHYLLLSLLPLRLVEWVRQPSLAAANGQFMLFNANDYIAHQWHERARKKVVEDVEIMRDVKRNKLKGAVLLENNLIQCRMYCGFSESVNGFSKNLLAGFGNSIAGLLVFLYLTTFGIAFFYFTSEWYLLGAYFMGVIFLRSMISGMADQNPLLNVLLHVPQMLVLIYIAFHSIAGKLTRSGKWKGRKIHT
jgi:glycosyltransferase involved in cell wall biosynthesis